MYQQKQNEQLLFAVIVAGSILLAYVIIYQLQTLTEFWHTVLIDGLIALAATGAAVSASLLYSMFDPQDNPRPIWMHFALALWAWAIAETIWMVIDLFFGDFIFSIADALWLLGYVFFAISISIQYRVLYRWNRQKEVVFIIGGLALTALLATLCGLVIEKSIDIVIFTLYFYPIADALLGVAVLWLAITFRGSTLAAPWVGLLVLIVADALYLWAMTTDFYWIAGGTPRLVVDTTYVFAYLIFALGCYSPYLLYKSIHASSQAK